MKILFIDSTHTLFKKNLEKQKHSCDTAYHKSKEEIEKTRRSELAEVKSNIFKDFIRKL